jgi:hypothetical protein
MVQEKRCNYVYTAIVEANQIYTDLTDRFPTTSLSGNKYILVLYDYGSTAITTEAMKNRGNKEMVRAYEVLIRAPMDRGLKPCLRHLYNEVSAALTGFLLQEDNRYQLAPPHMHRRNAEERAIQTC